MFWNGDYSSEVVRLGMYVYVFKPLGMKLPNDNSKYKRAVDITFEYVTMASLSFVDDFVNAIKNMQDTPAGILTNITEGTSKRPGYQFWKVANKYNSTSIETVATTKSKILSGHVAEARSFDQIVPSPVIDSKELAYSDETLRFLHDLSYRRYHENPVGLTRSLVGYMKKVIGTPVSNIHVGSFLLSLVKSHRACTAVKLILRVRQLPGLCLGIKNKDVRRIMDLFTVKMCPWCCKPVNVVVKKKASAGAAHRSHIFTDDYTHELLFCTEKNNRGIMFFPLVSVGCDGVYANDLEWTIDSGFTRVFTIETTCTGVRMVIYNRKTGAQLYVPAAIDGGFCGRCITCNLTGFKANEQDMSDMSSPIETE